ncbi:Mobile element protein [Methanosarcina sp. Kolksee]|uniref:Mobile element protein n=1 Tax=Methanosarcina vacuolata Z-761 TaxID=1434123 RepID=A0A0E3Q5E9_9EURY|nr:Mobile element protein [Methanosarcina vacuolata Z-761]AKB47343.1 Mobile element protein [Methanosarcina sp. Kolksee]
MLELYEVKVSRTVLRRERESNLPDLADLQHSATINIKGESYRLKEKKMQGIKTGNIFVNNL